MRCEKLENGNLLISEIAANEEETIDTFVNKAKKKVAEINITNEEHLARANEVWNLAKSLGVHIKFSGKSARRLSYIPEAHNLPYGKFRRNKEERKLLKYARRQRNMLAKALLC